MNGKGELAICLFCNCDGVSSYVEGARICGTKDSLHIPRGFDTLSAPIFSNQLRIPKILIDAPVPICCQRGFDGIELNIVEEEQNGYNMRIGAEKEIPLQVEKDLVVPIMLGSLTKFGVQISERRQRYLSVGTFVVYFKRRNGDFV